MLQGLRPRQERNKPLLESLGLNFFIQILGDTWRVLMSTMSMKFWHQLLVGFHPPFLLRKIGLIQRPAIIWKNISAEIQRSLLRNCIDSIVLFQILHVQPAVVGLSTLEFTVAGLR